MHSMLEPCVDLTGLHQFDGGIFRMHAWQATSEHRTTRAARTLQHIPEGALTMILQ